MEAHIRIEFNWKFTSKEKFHVEFSLSLNLEMSYHISNCMKYLHALSSLQWRRAEKNFFLCKVKQAEKLLAKCISWTDKHILYILQTLKYNRSNFSEATRQISGKFSLLRVMICALCCLQKTNWEYIMAHEMGMREKDGMKVNRDFYYLLHMNLSYTLPTSSPLSPLSSADVILFRFDFLTPPPPSSPFWNLWKSSSWDSEMLSNVNCKSRNSFYPFSMLLCYCNLWLVNKWGGVFNVLGRSRRVSWVFRNF